MTAAQLSAAFRDRFRDTRLIVVANREPYVHHRRVRPARGLLDFLRRRKQRVSIEWDRPASGLVTALDPVMRACGGTWIAHGGGSGDRESADDYGRLRVPPDRPAYVLRRMWLTPEAERGYYYGLANSALWPLCHIVYARPEFNESDWQQYVAVNRRFADAVMEEAGDGRAVVFVQDYHFALLPRMVKEARPDLTVCQFWHIPWPNREVFRVCPWSDEIVHGLLGNDLLAFHIQYHCNNFFETVEGSIEARVDREHFAVWLGGRPTFVKPFPISIDPAEWQGPSKSQEKAAEIQNVRRLLDLTDEKIVFGVDRLDYTKGIPDRLRAFERLLHRYPQWRGKVTMLQVGAPSRDHLQRYQELAAEVDACVQDINERHGNGSWRPIVYRPEHHTHEQIAALYRAADVCVVSSLHDGMNLVAKEFIAAREDERGVLVLSSFTGAARELDQAVAFNPFATDAFADALHTALAMPAAEQARRMRALRQTVLAHTVFDWASSLLTAAARMDAALAR